MPISTWSWWRPTASNIGAAGPALRTAQGRDHVSMVPAERQWKFEPVKRTERVANGTLDIAADKPAHLSLPVKWGRYRLEVDDRRARTARSPRVTFDAGFYAEVERRHARPAWRSRSTRRTTSRRHAERRGHRALGRPPHAQRVHRPAGRQPIRGREGRHRAGVDAGRRRLGHRRLSGGDAAPAARRGGQAHARPRHRRAVVRHRPRARTRLPSS